MNRFEGLDQLCWHTLDVNDILVLQVTNDSVIVTIINNPGIQRFRKCGEDLWYQEYPDKNVKD